LEVGDGSGIVELECKFENMELDVVDALEGFAAKPAPNPGATPELEFDAN
jgi:hypothetical protein